VAWNIQQPPKQDDKRQQMLHLCSCSVRFMHSINVVHYDLKLTTCVSFMIAIRAVTSDLSWNFFQINDLLALMIFEVLGLQCFLLGTLIQLTDFKLMISLGLGCELRSWCYVFVVLFSSTSCLFVLDYKQSCTLTGTSSAIPSVCRTEESANCNCMGVGVNIE